jgi:hypothetical protein
LFGVMLRSCMKVNGILLICFAILVAGCLILPRIELLFPDNILIPAVRYVEVVANKPADTIINRIMGENRVDLSSHDAAVMIMQRAGTTVIAVFVSLAACLILYLNHKGGKDLRYGLLTFSLIIVNGTLIRLLLAYMCYGNFDMKSWEIAADIAMKGGNIYAESNRHTSSPVWFLIIGALKWFQLKVGFEFHFVLRSFLTAIDLLTVLCLCFIARWEGTAPIVAALLYYLNPVSFLLTGYHGQFENIAVLMLLLGIVCYYRFRATPWVGHSLLWILATFGLVVKHNVLCQFLSCVNAVARDLRWKLLLIFLSVALFVASFIPYWETGSQGIIRNVFQYGASPGIYGITSFIDLRIFKYCFMIGALIFPLLLQGDDIVEHCMISGLFFLVFTTGAGVQYFILPISFAALRPSKGFLMFTIVTTLFLLGSPVNLATPGFNALRLNLVWLAAIYWFVTAMFVGSVSVTARPRINPTGPPSILTIRKTWHI